MNHFSFNDGPMLHYICRKALKKEFKVMVLEEQMLLFKPLKYVGCFSVNKKSRTLVESLDYAASLLSDKQNMLGIFPQGGVFSLHLDKVHFENIMYCEYSHEEFHGQEGLLAQKSVDELFEIIQKLECHVYGLYEYPKQLKQLVLFNKKSQQYDFCDLRMDDDDVESNIFIPSNFIKDSPLNDEISPPIHDIFIEHDIELKGTLEELSDTPLLLQRLIQENPDIQFYPPNSLKLHFKDLAQVNALLKEQIEKEAHYLNIEEIYQLEKQLNQPKPTTPNEQEDKLFAIWLCNEEKYYYVSKYGHHQILTYTNPEYFALNGTFILKDEIFLSKGISSSVTWLLSIFAALIALVLLLMTIRFASAFKRLHQYYNVIRPLLLCIVVYSIFFLFWMPEILEFWIFQMILVWLLLVGMLPAYRFPLKLSPKIGLSVI
ncbi:MAG: hypothetical protein EOP00_19260, partial [Pedobacter sp.]